MYYHSADKARVMFLFTFVYILIKVTFLKKNKYFLHFFKYIFPIMEVLMFVSSQLILFKNEVLLFVENHFISS